MRAEHVILPYEQDIKLRLDSSATDSDSEAWIGELHYLVDDESGMDFQEEEVGRILLCAAVLFQREVGSLGQCLRTAMIWERG